MTGKADRGVAQDDVGHQPGELHEVGFAHAEAGHLGDTQAQASGGGEGLFVGQPLVVAEDVAGLEARGHLVTATVADPTMTWWVSVNRSQGRPARRDRRRQRPGEGLGVGDHLGW